MNVLRWSALIVFAGVVAAVLWLQRHDGTALKAERALRQTDRRELAAAQAENARLKTAQPAPAELERMRADHAAITRLRSEIETLRARAAEKERASAETPKVPVPMSAAPVAMDLKFRLGADGSLALPQGPTTLEEIQARFAQLAKGDAVKITVQLPATDNRGGFEAVTRSMKAIANLAKERGLRFEMTIEQPTP